jgi:hypothetical protein
MREKVSFYPRNIPQGRETAGQIISFVNLVGYLQLWISWKNITVETFPRMHPTYVLKTSVSFKKKITFVPWYCTFVVGAGDAPAPLK